MRIRRKAGHVEVDPAERRKMLGLRVSIDSALKKLVNDYHNMESVNRELKLKAKSASTELELAKSKLESFHATLKVHHTREINLLSFLFKGLKSPLIIIAEHIRQLENGKPNDGDRAASLEQLRIEVSKLGRIIDDLANVEAVQMGTAHLKVEKVSLEEVVDRVTGEHERTTQNRGVVLNKIIAKGLPHIMGDREQLKVALSHLVDNSISFTPTGGVVTILANGSQPGGRVQLSVVDMREGALDKAGMQVLQGVFPGKRLGDADVDDVDLRLIVARQIISAHNGEIKVESEAGKKTVFTLTLPAVETGEADKEKKTT
jgi:signal transduction histidine kinase